MPRAGSPYGPTYERERRELLAGRPRCAVRLVCNGSPATEADHQPPLKLHVHVEGSGCCVLVPSCGPCARKQGARLAAGMVWDRTALEVLDPVGFDVGDAVWDVSWLDEFRDVPDDATWPRLMTVPHERAVGSFGAQAAEWVQEQMGVELRWWQRLALTRELEHDERGWLVWLTVLLTTARQVGKSTELRGAAAWRIHQASRWGEPQTVVHTGKDLPVCKEVQALARAWAKARGYPVREQNGNEEISVPWSDSRWIVRGKGSVYGYSGSSVLGDEAWGIAPDVVDDGLEPTMLERRSPQLKLASTAHPRTTGLFPGRRNQALERLGAPRRTLLLEWSARREAGLDDLEAWRQASPHWHENRADQIAERIDRIMRGEDDETGKSVDPIASARCQVLNIWPSKVMLAGRGDRLIPRGAWGQLGRPGTARPRRLWVAVEDNYGDGAAVAAVAELDDGDRIEVDGWVCESRDAAIGQARALVESFDVPARLIVGASIPAPRGVSARAAAAETRVGLPLLRSILGRLVHDETPDLAAQLETVRVREVAGGLAIVPGTRADLVRAVAWALLAAVVRRPTPAIHVAENSVQTQ